MSGLRERQKELRREAILVAAMSLFDSNGYNPTSVEQIAAAAGVSPPTVFKYFGSKQEILFALLDRADRIGIDEARIQIANSDNAVDVICGFYAAIAKRELDALPVSIWRELINFSFGFITSEVMEGLSQRLVQECAALLRELQDRGMIRSNFDVDLVAEFFNDYSVILFAKLVQQDVIDYQEHLNHVRRVVEVVFAGLHP